MKHILFGPNTDQLKTVLLIKEAALQQSGILTHYINPLAAKGIKANTLVAVNLKYQDNNKCSAACAKDYISGLLPALDKLNIDTLLCADSVYFKYLTKSAKAEPFHGTIVPCAIEGFTHMKVILSVNFQAMEYNPAAQSKLDLSLATLATHLSGSHTTLGSDIIKSEYYPKTLDEIKSSLDTLMIYPELTCDIEGLSLDFWDCGISTITFCWNQHEGIAFPVDRGDCSTEVRALLKDFLCKYQGKLTYHNAGFDIKVLVYTLWMKNLADYRGMLDGIDLLTQNFDDTKLIAYLATNNAVKNELGLKILAHEFAGNWAEDIKDTSKIPLNRLLKYNLIDGLSTWYVKNKYYPIMVQDQQEALYTEMFKPSVKTLLQTELCGMPIDPVKVQEAKAELTEIVDQHAAFFKNDPVIQDFHHGQLQKLCDEYTTKAKKKVYALDDPIIAREEFNPGSGTQLRALIYDYFGYGVIDLTDGKQPATGVDTLQKLRANSKSNLHTEIFDHLIGRSAASIILSTFIPAFERAQQLPDGSWRLYGNFNLGGTQSLRLSSSNPNLQNIPSNSVYAKIIKACFVSTKDWVFSGSDFDSLEDKVNTLVTKDPNKIKVYVDGFDGHCLRAFYYFRDQMLDIMETVPSINSIKKLYPQLRQDSKAPTFALTYMGTWHTLVNNCGFPKLVAKQIEKNYHDLYAVSDAWIAAHIETAKTTGYVPLAFGGRIRTPILARCKPGQRMPYMAQAEARSAGNAATQSYCFLNVRAANKFMELVWASEFKYDILPAAQIHDACYFVIRNDPRVAKFVNDKLIEVMAWQGLPELQHPIIRMSSALDIFYKNWCNGITIKNGASEEELLAACKKGKQKYDTLAKAA